MIHNTYIKEEALVIGKVLGKKDGIVRKFLIDIDDLDKVSKHTWNWKKGGYIFCTCCGKFLHRFLIEPKKEEDVDHINHNTSDNRKINIRAVSTAENMWNRGATKNNTVPVKGVYWTGASWSTEIVKHGHCFKKSGFDTLPEAICYKIRKEYELYGDKSPNYRTILNKMPQALLKIYFPEIYGKRNQEFIGTPIFNAHYKNRTKKNWHLHTINVRKAGQTV